MAITRQRKLKTPSLVDSQSRAGCWRQCCRSQKNRANGSFPLAAAVRHFARMHPARASSRPGHSQVSPASPVPWSHSNPSSSGNSWLNVNSVRFFRGTDTARRRCTRGPSRRTIQTITRESSCSSLSRKSRTGSPVSAVAKNGAPWWKPPDRTSPIPENFPHSFRSSKPDRNRTPSLGCPY